MKAINILNKVVLGIALTAFSIEVNAQCQVNITPASLNVLCGDTVDLI